MTINVIYQLVEVALSLAQSELEGPELERTLLDIIQKGVEAYQEQKGEPLDPRLVSALHPL